MFSLKHFSWKKWSLLTIFLFFFTFLLAYLIGLADETKEQLLTVSSLLRRLITAMVVGLFISLIKTDTKQ